MPVGRRYLTLAAATVLVASAGIVGWSLRGDHAGAAATHAVAPPRTASPAPLARVRSTRTYSTVPLPVRVRVPGIAVNSGLQHLGKAPDGSVEVPNRWEVAGWYTG